jgi:hypothetical protein
MHHNGPGLVIALGLLGLVLAVTGSGRLGLDHLLAHASAGRHGVHRTGGHWRPVVDGSG